MPLDPGPVAHTRAETLSSCVPVGLSWTIGASHLRSILVQPGSLSLQGYEQTMVVQTLVSMAEVFGILVNAPDAADKATKANANANATATAPRIVRLAVLAPPSVPALRLHKNSAPTYSEHRRRRPLMKHEPRVASGIRTCAQGSQFLPMVVSNHNANSNAHSGNTASTNANGALLSVNPGGAAAGGTGTGTQVRDGTTEGAWCGRRWREACGLSAGCGFSGGGSVSWKGESLCRTAGGGALEGPGCPRVVHVLAGGERLGAVAGGA
ncbi:hypothetical protein B0H11DRAFT_2278848 [Mycena galericulata]|nr:hypothetical protein B0H11DRAFT_2278848 [Mycena galericulata]